MTSWAQTIMLHEIIMWPDQVDLALWPFALERSIYIWNNLPKPDSHLAPIEIYSLKKSNHKYFNIFMSGDVLPMFWIQNYRMVTISQNENLAAVEECI